MLTSGKWSGTTMQNIGALGLNQNLQFNDLSCKHTFNIRILRPLPDHITSSAFMTAAGFAGASVMYDLPPPAFVRPPYTVAPFLVCFPKVQNLNDPLIIFPATNIDCEEWDSVREHHSNQD